MAIIFINLIGYMIFISKPVIQTSLDPIDENFSLTQDKETYSSKTKAIMGLAAGALTIGVGLGVYKNWNSIATALNFLPSQIEPTPFLTPPSAILPVDVQPPSDVIKTVWKGIKEINIWKSAEDTTDYLKLHVKPYVDACNLSPGIRISLIGVLLIAKIIFPNFLNGRY